MRLEDLETPAALVDLDIVERNTARMSGRISELGAALRPHVKTHKCAEAARLQVRGQQGSITVSTLAEARFFRDHGFEDITWAFPVPLDRLHEITRLTQEIPRFQLLADHPDTVSALNECAARENIRFSVLLKVDCGDHRCGVDPSSEDGLQLAEAMAQSSHLDFQGVLTHAGHSYSARDATEVLEIAGQERDVIVDFAEQVRKKGIPVPVVSLGSTPTMSVIDNLDGVTEARPGNYVFFDRYQASIGVCSLEDVAFSVLATVVGVYPKRNEIIINAGALALSKDPGAVHIDEQCGYGLITPLDGGAVVDDLRIASLSQEHGHVRVLTELDPARFKVGSKVRILPNHSCLTAALFDRYQVVRGDDVIDTWEPARGW